MTALSLDAVSVEIGDIHALAEVSLDLAPGEVLGVLGPSGSGKSTLLRVIAGLERPVSGSVSWDGTDLARVPVHKRGFALMFQDGQLFPHRDVAANVGYAFGVRHVARDARAPRITELLELVGLAGYESRSISTLSGGEQQRVALARALGAQPRLLLLDEPLSALDRPLRSRLARDLREILVATGTPAVLVSHDPGESAVIADRIAVLVEGRIVQHGTQADLVARPASPLVAALLAAD
jgi:thiamine transport system ATP-binding protein